jgi:diguanylate cyclase (GGDEF)-like protein
MDRLLDEEISRARRHRRALSLVMVDVDRFKQVNDTFGHQAGDRALQAVASVLLGCVRSHDQVARYGGEEFAIILPETNGTDALAVAERMRARVAGEVFVAAGAGANDARRPITISVGIATLVEGKNSRAEQLVRDADNGLYAAKRGGRNRCVVIAGGLRRGENPA